ncbi:MAG: FAD binding domain-containing protein [Candidatus Lambdaproteobacteria bacterium]|nr:FAD binding domain-containing protein [Candidatus Lambdaproteobacteria bacterium]
MRPFDYVEPTALAEATRTLHEGGEAVRVLAGGTDLLGELKDGLVACERVVSLARLPGLAAIEPEGQGLRVGAMVTLAGLVEAPQLSGPYALLAQVAQGVATPEVRNQGTLGGNLCQRPRCLHYRSPAVACLKKGGSGCPARESPFQAYLSVMGEAGCVATHPSDLALPLLALGAEAWLAGPQGERRLPLDAFFSGTDGDPRRETALGAGELLTAVWLPPAPAGWRGLHRKERDRTAGDFAVAGVAVGCAVEGGTIRHARVALGGLAPAPARSSAAEAVLDGRAPSRDLAERAAQAALAAAKPLPHNAYKVRLARVLLARALEALWG